MRLHLVKRVYMQKGLIVAISIFDLFKIGIGPSSSHTVGPMRASSYFIKELYSQSLETQVAFVNVDLYGSLALTGIGHGTDKALILGLLGETPEQVDPESIDEKLAEVRQLKKLLLDGKIELDFDPRSDIRFNRRKSLPYHPNGMTFHAYDTTRHPILTLTYYSIGGGFVVDELSAKKDKLEQDPVVLPFGFKSGAELLQLCKTHNMSIADVQKKNEKIWRSEEDINQRLDYIWQVMKQCIDRGCQQTGFLPGPLKVARRAPHIYKDLMAKPQLSLKDPLSILDWVNLYALAVNEENAAGSRVVTAPTNGAAGIIPSVLRYYEEFHARATQEGVREFLLTAAAIGILYAQNASISGAEVGCQGEVGVACSMAAGGLVGAMGGTPKQVEQAAEIGMEHNLGLTCDPIGGLVQIPCIERNAMGAVKAINAARIALKGSGEHHVSLDSVIKTMLATGADMKTKYKETSRGGLAVNVTEC